jgi:DNA polymerase III subunit epsilon
MFDFKGKNLIDFPDDYTLIDLETTGIDLQYDEIIEISALRIRNNQIVDTFSSLVCPKFPISEFITDLTGITKEMLEKQPKIEDILPKFIDFIQDDILVGHNIFPFDANFLCRSCFHLEKKINNNYVDTLRLARRLLPELKHHRLIDLANNFEIEYQNMHRAEKDCQITKICFDKLKQMAITKCGSISEFIKSTKKKNYQTYAKDIVATTNEFDIDSPFYQKVCVFTGKLEKMTRTEAMQTIKNIGGENGDTITKKTNFLIVGNMDYTKRIKDGKSSKIKKAEKYKLDGLDIEVISEDTFYTLIENK